MAKGLILPEVLPPKFSYSGPSPIPFSLRKLHTYIDLHDNQEGFFFHLGQEKVEPNLDSVEIMHKLNWIPFHHFRLKKHNLSVFEHFLATMYANGIDNYGVHIHGNSLPQNLERELILHNLIMEKSFQKKRYSFQNQFMFPEREFKTRKKGGIIKVMPSSSETLTINVKCKYEDLVGVYSFSPEKDNFADIASSKAYSKFPFTSNNYYHKNVTPENIIDIAKHTVVDILGAVALLANQKKARIHGEIYCYLGGHYDHLSMMKQFQQYN